MKSPATNIGRLNRTTQLSVLCFLAATLFPAIPFSPLHINAKQLPQTDLTVHEWGTFTSIAGPDGDSMNWLPLTGSTELPSFVEHFREVAFKGGLRGTVRMETPVLYFYSQRETSISVNVSFARGLITEWYPHADSINTALTPRDYSLFNIKSFGSIAWNSVHIDPQGATDFPTDNSGNHYYAARHTSSAPLSVESPAGSQREKFLFYRGVSAISVPINATVAADSTVQIENQFAEEIPAGILFERRGAQLGYRMLGPLRDQASYAPPDLSASLDFLSTALESILVSQGLFAGEAHAMLETWQNSWFEEGSRLIYIVPRPFIDAVLPLHVAPAPSATARVFVGRLELVTPATERAVEASLASNDLQTLAKYNRFLEPILSAMIQKAADPARIEELQRYLQEVWRGPSAASNNSTKSLVFPALLDPDLLYP
ncbi:MAG TPA: hypothetical protein VK728_18130 [Candidatus Sulfotelmatobacter sp.]|nr:hypothetical protein [Candidatus Sulfotelmatobacter sp.]